MLDRINYGDHPTNRNKMVFRFREAEQADDFEQRLKEHELFYEKQIDTEGDQSIYFGVKKTDYKQAKNLNFLTAAKFRKRFIPDPFFRGLLLIVSIGILLLAIIGAILSN